MCAQIFGGARVVARSVHVSRTTHLQCDVFGRGGKVDPGATGPALHNSVEVRCSPDTDTAHDTQCAVGRGRSCRGGNNFRLAGVCKVRKEMADVGKVASGDGSRVGQGGERRGGWDEGWRRKTVKDQ